LYGFAGQAGNSHRHIASLRRRTLGWHLGGEQSCALRAA